MQETSSSKASQGIIFVSVAVTLILMILVVSVADESQTAASQPVRLSTGEWAPYTGESLPYQGVASAIVTRVFENMGYQPEYYFMPWSAAEEAAAAEESDLGIRASFPYSDPRDDPQQEDSRSSRFYFSDSLLEVKLKVFYHRRHNPQGATIVSPEDLSHHTLVKIQGYEYPPELSRYLNAPGQWLRKDNHEAFETLLSSEQPLIIIEAEDTGRLLLETRYAAQMADIVTAPIAVSRDVRVMFAKRNPNNLSLMRDFNRSLARLKSNARAFDAFINNAHNKIALARSVALVPLNGESLIVAYEDANRGRQMLLPRGSKALIKQWPAHFLSFHSDLNASSEALVKVELLNGPNSVGKRLVYVDGGSIVLPEPIL